jgi:hypothetical protein
MYKPLPRRFRFRCFVVPLPNFHLAYLCQCIAEHIARLYTHAVQLRDWQRMRVRQDFVFGNLEILQCDERVEIFLSFPLCESISIKLHVKITVAVQWGK